MHEFFKHYVLVFILIGAGIVGPAYLSRCVATSGADAMGAYAMSQKYVGEQLKIEATIDFPWYEESLVTELGENKFKVSAYVDVAEEEDKKTRVNYSCVLTHDEDANVWTMESLDMNPPAKNM